MSTDDERRIRSHPSYATVTLQRIPHGTSRTLFQSDFQHQQTVSLEIHSAEVFRANSEDYVMSTNRLISVEMSPLQLADLLTGFGNTGPVPATLRFLSGDQEPRPTPPAHNVKSQFSDEHREALDDIITAVDELIQHPNLSVEARRKAEGIKTSLTNRLPFIEDQFEKHVQHTAADARASITAFAELREQLAGRSALSAPTDSDADSPPRELDPPSD